MTCKRLGGLLLAAMLLLSLPLFEKVAELAASLIGGTGAGTG